MSAKPANARIITLQTAEVPPFEASTPLRGDLLAIEEDGSLLVRAHARDFRCDWLEGPTNAGIHLELGDRLLFMPPVQGEPGVVLGRIGRYHGPQPQEHVTIEASETLTLKCGEASVELRNDGRAMVKGEEVLLRAKGTQRIRAATVAIN